ncbi:hypothetical protein CCP3SC15_450001 [Gammaproteobacteria bacterium]
MKAQAFKEKPGLVLNPLVGETGKAFRDLVRTAGLTMEQVKAMTPGERLVAGLTEAGAIKELQPSGPGWWNKLTNLTPESKALLSAQQMKENLGVLLAHLPADEQVGKQLFEILNATAKGDMETVKEMGAAFMDNPEMYTSMGAVRDFIPKLRELAANFDLARPNREMFWKVQELLGEEASNVLKHFTDGDPAPDFERLVKLAGESGKPEAKAFMESVKAGDVTAQSLAEMFKVFTDNRVAIHPQEFKALVLDKFYDHMGQWGVDYFKVEKAGQFQEALRMMKGAQSLMLLDFSPSYLVNNFLNNRVLMAAGGVLGLTPVDKIGKWLGEFGVTPARMSEGFGPAETPLSLRDIPPNSESANLGGVVSREMTGEAPKSAETIIHAAQQGSGPMTAVADAIGKVRKATGIFSKLSSKVEGDASKQMYYSAMKSFYGRTWKAGVGFERMPAVLEMKLRNAGVDMSVFYNNLEGMVSTADFEKLANGATTHTVDGFINDAATKLGQDPADVAEMLHKLGVMDDLKERISQAKTPEQVVRAFEAVEQKALEGVDRQMAGELQGRAEQIAQKVRAEGPAGALEVFNDLTLENMDRKLENDRIWNEAFAKSREANNKALASQYMEKAANENRAAWRRSQAFEAAGTRGVIEGLGLDSEFKRELLTRQIEQHETLGKFFELRNKELRQFFKTEFQSMEARQAAWDSLEWEHNQKFAQANNHVLKLQGEMDGLFAGEFGRVFGPSGEVTARAWRDGVMKLSAEMHDSITAFRDSLRGMSAVERERAWKQFQPEYQKMWQERAAANVEGANGLYKFDNLPPSGSPLGNAERNSPQMPAGERGNLGGVTQQAFSLNQNEAGGAGLSDAEIASWSQTVKDDYARAAAAVQGAGLAGGGGAETAAPTSATGAVDLNNSVVAARVARESEIFGVMNEFGMATADEAGRPLPKAKIEMLNAVRAYGPRGAEMIRSFNEITPEVARMTLEKMNAPVMDVEKFVSDIWNSTESAKPLDEVMAERKSGDEIINGLSGADRRVPAFEQLREKWTDLPVDDQKQVIDWLMNKTVIDPMTGLETLVSKSMETAGKPEGWIDGMSDLNGMKGINDTFGHPAGDAVLAGMGAVIKDEVAAVGGRAFRVGGDEVSYWFPNQASADAALRAIDQHFKSAIITFEDANGQKHDYTGFTISYGSGADTAAADVQLYTDKQRRLDIGERPKDRGSLPGTISPAVEHPGVQAGRFENVNPVPDQTAAGREPAAVTRQQEIHSLIQTKAVSDLPGELRGPVTESLRAMLDEVKAGRKKSLLEFIKEKGGIDITQVRDVTGEGKVQRKWGPGLFRKGGIGLDELAQRMADEYYLTPGQLENPFDNGGVNAAVEMIQKELAGEKSFSYWEEGKLENQPQWYQNIRGLKNKQGAVQMFLERMLNGNENAKFGMEPTAAERAIKAEVFSRLGDLAASDGRLAEATGLPFDYRAFDERLGQVTAGLDTSTAPESAAALSARKQELSDTFDAVSELYRNLPKDAPEEYQNQISAIYEQIDQEGAKLEQVQKIGEAYAEYGNTMREMQAHAERLAMGEGDLFAAEKPVGAIIQEAMTQGQFGFQPKGWEQLTLDAWKAAVDELYSEKRTTRSVLGNKIVSGFRDTGITALVGQKVASSDDLATLAQVYRNPKFETLRYFFTKDGEIVGQLGVSSRMPGASKLFPDSFGDEGSSTQMIKDMMFNLEADGYYMQHNHPSGNSVPSLDDIQASKWLGETVPGYKGHVIINHQEWSFINTEGRVSTIKDFAQTNTYDLTDPSKYTVPHPALGTLVQSPADLARLSFNIQNDPEKIVLVTTSRQSDVKGIMEIAPTEFRNETRGVAILDKYKRETGAMSAFAYNIPLEMREMAKAAIENELLVDAYLAGETRSLREIGITPKQNTLRRARSVTDEAAPYRYDENGFELPVENPKKEGSQLFQEGGDVPTLPVGGYDQTSGYMDVGKLMQDGWAEKVKPVWDAMKAAALSPERKYALNGFDDATQKQLSLYLQQVKSQMASTKHAALRWGETQRDFAMLNYSKQYGFDKQILNGLVPYQFFMTRSAANWMTRVLDRPAWASQYVRMRNLQNTYQNQLPERMRGKIRIPLPFLPEWAGGGMYIDPSPQFMPFKMFLQPLEAMQRDETNLANSAGYVLNEWAGDGTYTQQQIGAAQQARSGPVWERAVEEAKIRQNGEGNTGADYFSMLFSPALYLTLPYYLATGKDLLTGKPGAPSSALPITRTGMALETAFKGTALEPLGNAAGLIAKPEQWVRQQKGLSDFGEWGDFYLDRQMANLAAEGKYNVKDVQRAMIERKGPIYDEAYARVQQEVMLRVPGMAGVYGAAHGAQLDQIIGSMLPSLFPGGLLPEGEMAYKGLKQEYGLAWDAYKSGNPKAISEFFDKHPEYQARLALRRDPQERLQQFLKSEIWDGYNALGPTNKKQANALLGPDFGDFLGSEPGVEFSSEKLATWARLLGGMVPQTTKDGGQGTMAAGLDTGAQNVPYSTTGKAIDLFGPEVTSITDRFFKERTEKFPSYYVIQAGYYSLPKSEQGKYLLKFPELKQYWDWKDKWYKAYPEYQPVFKGEVFKRVDTSGWNPALVEQVQMYALTGQRLGKGARQLLEQYWVRAGKPYDNLQSWLDSEVVASMKYGQGQ